MYRTKYYGMSLIELLISIVLSSILVFSTYQIVQLIAVRYYRQQQLVKSYQDKQFIEYMFTQKIHLAGYFGCNSIERLTLYSSLHSLSDLVKQTLGATNINLGIYGYTQAKRDVLVVRYLDPRATSLLSAMTFDNVALVTLNSQLKNKDIAAVSDCHTADIFSVSHIGRDKSKISHQINALNAKSSLHKTYASLALVGKLISQQIYLKNHGIYVKDFNKSSQELISGVDVLHFFFSSQFNPSVFKSPDHYRDWQYLQFVKIKFKLAGEKAAEQFIVRVRNR